MIERYAVEEPAVTIRGRSTGKIKDLPQPVAKALAVTVKPGQAFCEEDGAFIGAHIDPDYLGRHGGEPQEHFYPLVALSYPEKVTLLCPECALATED